MLPKLSQYTMKDRKVHKYSQQEQQCPKMVQKMKFWEIYSK